VHHFKSIDHVAGLRALAVAQPVFDLLTRSPELFVADRADFLDVLFVAAAGSAGDVHTPSKRDPRLGVALTRATLQ
jgi:hypothetical protein